jgi:hypothetical protein
VRLACVLDDLEAMRFGDAKHPPHIRHLAVEVDRQDVRRSVCSRLLSLIDVDVVVSVCDIHDERRPAGLEHGRERRSECARGDDHAGA